MSFKTSVITSIIACFIGACASPSLKKFSSEHHCTMYMQCAHRVNEPMSDVQYELCLRDTDEQKKLDKGPFRSDVIDAFYTNCYSLEPCGYVICMMGHRDARVRGEAMDSQTSTAAQFPQ